MQRFLKPHQRDVTKMLLYIAQASHALVPPEVRKLRGLGIVTIFYLYIIFIIDLSLLLRLWVQSDETAYSQITINTPENWVSVYNNNIHDTCIHITFIYCLRKKSQSLQDCQNLTQMRVSAN